LQHLATKNVTFAGFLSDDALHHLYGTAAVYVQPSLHEAFGMSVAEAMLGGCIPVVTRKGALPEVVGETGIYCESNAPENVASAIEQALRLDYTWRQNAKDYILSRFPIERRRTALQRLVHCALDTGSR
jgi:glycosyltransferase involved in cell wall biosynthesis